jgi:hypothetical protein
MTLALLQKGTPMNNNNQMDIYDLLRSASSDISAIAEMCDIDWQDLLGQINRGQVMYKNSIAIDKKLRGKVCAYVNFKTSDKGYEGVSITFKTFRRGGCTETWNSYEWLKDNGYLNKKDFVPVVAGKSAPVARAKKSHTSEYNQKMRQFNAFKAVFDKLPVLANVADTYFEKKGFTLDDIAVECRRGYDHRGGYIIYALRNDKQAVTGFQSIYDVPFIGYSGETRDKDFKFQPFITNDNNLVTLKTGSYTVLGTPQNKDDLILCSEGLATGITAFKAEGTPCVVCLDAGNLPAVVQSLRNQGYTNIKIVADNDIKDGGGNAGIYAALKSVRYTDIKIVAPIMPDGTKCDFDDLRQKYGIEEVARQLTESKIPTHADDSLEYHCALLKYAPTNQLEGLIARACRYAGYYKITTVAEYRAVFKRIKTAVKEHGFKDYRIVRHWLKKYVNEKLDTIRAENEITDWEGVTVHDFTGKDNNAIVDKVLSLGCGIFLDNRGMGVGKTSEVMKPIADYYLNRIVGNGKAKHPEIKQSHFDNGGDDASWNVISNNPKLFKVLEDELNRNRTTIEPRETKVVNYVCHRISLTSSASEGLKLTLYDDVNPHEFSESMAICVNSIPKHEISKTVKVLFLDEIRQNLEHVLNGTVFNRVAVEAELKAAVQNADLVICADADMNDFTLNWIKSIANKPMHAITQKVVKTEKILLELGNAGAALIHAKASLKKGLNVWFSTDSMQQSRKADIFLKSPNIMDKENAESIMTELMDGSGLTDDEVLVIHSENKGNPRQAAFLKNPTKESKKYRLIIHTPVISSGISITHNHFKRVYAIFCNVLSPNEMLQTIARVRTAKEIFVCFKSNHSKDRPTNLQDLLDGHAIKVGRFNPEKFITEYDDFDKLRLQHIATRNASLNDYRRYFIMLAQLKGYRFKQDDLKRWSIEGLSKAATEQKVNEISSAEEISDEQAKAIDLLANPTQEQTDCLHRHKVTQVTGKAFSEVDDTDIKFYMDNGLSKVSNFELVNADVNELKDADMANHSTRDKLASKTSKHYIFNYIVSRLKGNRINAAGAKGLCKFLQAYHKELASNRLGNYAKVSKYPVRQLGDFLKKFGYELVLDSNSKNSEQWWIFKANLLVEKYAENRAKKGAFQTENLENAKFGSSLTGTWL